MVLKVFAIAKSFLTVLPPVPTEIGGRRCHERLEGCPNAR